MQRPLTLSKTGEILASETGLLANGADFDAEDIAVDHLTPHIVTWALPRGEEVKVLVRYSCHCWTSGYDPIAHAGQRRIMDGTRPRVLDIMRLQASEALPEMISALDRQHIYVTASERNYGAYNASILTEDGLAYTLYFSVRPKRGRFDRVRHRLLMTVESAYDRPQPERGSKTSLGAILAAALEGKTVKYRH